MEFYIIKVKKNWNNKRKKKRKKALKMRGIPLKKENLTPFIRKNTLKRVSKKFSSKSKRALIKKSTETSRATI